MRVKKVTAKQAEKIMNRLGLDYGNDGRTYYLAKEDETAIWEFDTLAERNEAYEAEMAKENKVFTNIEVDGVKYSSMYEALKALVR